MAVCGKHALAIVGQVFSPASGQTFSEAAVGQIVFGRWGSPLGEELVVCRLADEEIEIHCHGGQAAVSAVLESLVERGCRQADWRDWIRQKSADAIAAPAVEALAQATTLRCAAILLDQFHGALANELDVCIRLLEAGDRESWQAAGSRLNVLAERTKLGRHLIEPFRVVVAGKPNVGKSSLINALAGYERSIVYDQPGTTRDVVSVRTAIDGWPVELSDTAGLRTSSDVLEAAGVQLAMERIAAADLRILVFDASQAWSESDAELLTRWSDAVVVYNKCDLAGPPTDAVEGVLTCAINGQGIDELLRIVGERLVPAPPQPGDAVPFTASHVEAIRSAIRLLEAGASVEATRLLRELPQRESLNTDG
jgi:tRNA modification GTPase